MNVFRTVNYQVYVLKNAAGRHYIGMSEDVFKRLADHNAGISRWTRNKGPWSLVWAGPQMALSDARKLENQLKAQKGGQGFFILTGIRRESVQGS